MDDVILDRREVDDFGEGVADLVQPSLSGQSDLALAELGPICSSKGRITPPICTRNCPAASLPAGGRHFLDAVNYRKTHCAATAVEAAE